MLSKRKTALVTIVLAGLLTAIFWRFVIRDPAYEVTAKILMKIGVEQAIPDAMLIARHC